MLQNIKFILMQSVLKPLRAIYIFCCWLNENKNENRKKRDAKKARQIVEWTSAIMQSLIRLFDDANWGNFHFYIATIRWSVFFFFWHGVMKRTINKIRHQKRRREKNVERWIREKKWKEKKIENDAPQITIVMAIAHCLLLTKNATRYLLLWKSHAKFMLQMWKTKI